MRALIACAALLFPGPAIAGQAGPGSCDSVGIWQRYLYDTYGEQYRFTLSGPDNVTVEVYIDTAEGDWTFLTAPSPDMRCEFTYGGLWPLERR